MKSTPNGASILLNRIASPLAEHGLILRGGFNFGPDEDAPAKAVLLVGHGGAGYWPRFQAWRARNPKTLDPLDCWSRMIIDSVAVASGARAVYPNDRPYMPFQQWAMRAEGLKPSPLGILMHPEFGLWHAYRGALLFDAEIQIPVVRGSSHLCELCDGKPCLNTCPVGAFTAGGYDVGSCRTHVRGEGVMCREQGCIARNACPHDAYRYPADVQAFHMAAFMSA